MSLREVGKERRRQRILTAAQAILCEDGLEGLATAKLAARAEVSVATLYNLIGSQETILATLLEQHAQDITDSLDQQLQQAQEGDQPLEQVLAYAEATYHFLSRDETGYRAVYRAVFQRNFGMQGNADIFASRDSSARHLHRCLQSLKNRKLLSSACNCRLLTEQMMMSQVILLQNWAVGLIDLQRFRLTGRLHLLSAMSTWSEPSFRQQLESMALQLQQQVLNHDRAARRRPATRTSTGINT